MHGESTGDVNRIYMENNLTHVFELIEQIIKLPVARLCFCSRINPDDVNSTYRYFTKPHPKYKLFKNKSLGAALIELDTFESRSGYLQKINKPSKSSAAYYARKARSRGYTVDEIDRNKFIDDIHEINISAEIRQGKRMNASYTEKRGYYEPKRNFKYYGVLDANGKLAAYCDVGFYGNFALLSRLLGHRDLLNDGVMYLMLAEIICRLIHEKSTNYVMYDTFFGAQPGLQLFKTKLGFRPYRVKYSLQ
jgi:hypothetical protein